MFKRAFWLTAGFGLGVAAARKAQQAAVHLTPDGLGSRLRDRWVAALDEGRDEMHRRELALREVFASPDGTRIPATRPPRARRNGTDGR
ncbi:MAG TPA: hypothetical protein VFC99_00420 [Acidimicrobiia bacterium]|nr:hypothetical protein [Acidimicrobiia bacterium]